MYPEQSDAEIQRLLNDPQYSDDAKEELSDAYYERTGRRVMPQSAEETKKPEKKLSYQWLLQDVQYHGITEAGKAQRIMLMLNTGLVDEKTAEKLLRDSLGEKVAQKYITE